MGKEHTAEELRTIQYLRKELDWYVHEASDLEYDQDKVRAMLNLVKILDPPDFDEDDFTPEKGLERFWKTMEFRQQIHEEMERMQRHGLKIVKAPIAFQEADGETQGESPAEPGKIQKFFQHKIASKVIIAAAVLVIVSVSGTVGAYAEKSGFFHFLSHKSDDGFAVITSPTIEDAESSKVYNYDSFESVPLKYLNYIWSPSSIPSDISLQFIEVRNRSGLLQTCSSFQNKELGLFAQFFCETYGEEVVITYQLHDSFEMIEAESIDSVKVQYYKKVNDDYTEYIAEFFYDHSYFYLDSNLSLEAIKKMISDSIEEINY